MSALHPDTPLTGQVAVVTGGSRGIGLAIARALCTAGADVAICHPDDPQAESALETLGRAGPGRAIALPADVSDEAQVVALFDQVADRLGVPDLVYANAGILHETPLRQTDAADFDRVIAVNLRGAFLTAREAARRMKKGRIIFTASDLGLLGRENMAAYCASKGGVIALTRSLARELAPDILVNAIAPGSIETDMTAGMTPEALARDLDTPAGRLGRPEEIAAMALFLAGADAGFVTGQCLGVNGGSAMY
ncbi:SDR family NAD(P)-dependent oxidoreductase [Brevirhabdus sp.]|uniref:SDR family NAD(P)-dependent oxidoreductase n=1 Tax=Brevirhabdus sp. TaxID=2004514 RepID=UPI00405907C2